MNHKRGRPKNRRAGCLMCKPWKGNGMRELRHSVKKQIPVEIYPFYPDDNNFFLEMAGTMGRAAGKKVQAEWTAAGLPGKPEFAPIYVNGKRVV